MIKKLILYILPLMLLAACKSGGGKSGQLAAPDSILNQGVMEVSGQAMNEIIENISSPVEIAALLKKVGAPFSNKYLASTDKAENFTSANQQALNLGVYGADLSYATLYNYQQEVNNYMNVIRGLANDLNMSKIYNAALYDSIKKNFDNKDRLVQILTKAFNDTYAYMSENDQQTLALLVVGGAWVEGMYLTTHVSEAAFQTANFSKVLLDQKKSFELYLDLTKSYMDDPMISNFVKNMDPIKKVYSALGTSLTLNNIKDITVAIATIRGKII